MPSYAALTAKQQELIRKGLDFSAFIGPATAAVITALTRFTPGPPAVIDLAPLPPGYTDLGLLTDDGGQFGRNIDASDITSVGRGDPSRRDIRRDTTTLQITCQETKKATIQAYTGVDLSAVTAAPNTGEVVIDKPATPRAKNNRLLALALDINADTGGEIYVGRFFPKASVTDYAEQQMHDGDNPIQYGLTYTPYLDSAVGTSERWLFGGAGWNSLLAKMGF
jgi:hypothetical protein